MESPHLFWVLIRPRGGCSCGGKYQTAREVGEQGSTLAHDLQESAHLVWGHHGPEGTLMGA